MCLPVDMHLPAGIGRQLANWLPRQRWFAGADQAIDEVVIVADTIVSTGDPGSHHVVVDVRQQHMVDRYQLLIGLRHELPLHLRQAEIASDTGGVHAYDAVGDPELTAVLLRQFADGARVGPLAFRLTEGARIDTGLPGRLREAEQSNTSVIFGDAYICKLFRRISPLPSPDLKVNLSLAQADCPHVPRLYGWAEDQAGATLALLSQYLPDSVDGWELAAESPPHFVREAESLGAVTASIHGYLARAFGVGTLSTNQLGELAEGMRRQLAEAVEEVPRLGAASTHVGAAFDDLAALDAQVEIQQIHGDLHLAQFLRTGTGWMMVDFEGEPYRATSERIAWASPIRDVAGMLRSFQYSAGHQLGALEGGLGRTSRLDPELARALALRAERWTHDCWRAFCQGYGWAGRHSPAARRTLLRAFVYDKAVYEVLFENRHRPSWLSIPLTFLLRGADGLAPW